MNLPITKQKKEAKKLEHSKVIKHDEARQIIVLPGLIMFGFD